MELLVRIEDKPDALGPLNAVKLGRRGFVVAVKADGFGWARRPLENLHWRILSVPEMGEAEARGLLTPPIPPDGRDYVLPKRGFTLDLDALPGDRNQFDPAEPRKGHISVAVEDIRAARMAVPAVERTALLKQEHTEAVVTFVAPRAGRDKSEFTVDDLSVVFDLGGADVDMDDLAAHTGRPLAEVIEAKTQSDARAEASAAALVEASR